MKFTVKIMLFLFLQSLHLSAQTTEKTVNPVDVQHYDYQIRVNDSTDVIYVQARVKILFKTAVSGFNLDLENQDASGKGMVIDRIQISGQNIEFQHANNRVKILAQVQKNSVFEFEIGYYGIPRDGLIIGKNKFGDRTFFGDNWPDRAHQWLICNDHPSDKATVNFTVIAPDHYQVIATGKLREVTNIDSKNILYRYVAEVPLPTKVMVIGVARFAREEAGAVQHIPVSTWVYPQNKKEGFYDYAQALEILPFFIEYIGPYPFSKLANVQSKTRYGGMENAGNIFYFEASVTGQRKHESLLAHEIAHQWFGDSATETGWEHLWLSEGFATYFTDLYFEHKYGHKRLQERMAAHREKVIRFSKNWKLPVIDTVTTQLIRRLNANSYEKGAWVLHMLRHEIGDAMFHKAIREYYARFAYKNASTEDLIKIFEKISGKNLDDFFRQWLYKPGHPVLKTSFVNGKNAVVIQVEQVQQNFPLFDFPLEIQLVYDDDSRENIRLPISAKSETFPVKTKGKVKEILLDPDVWLLYEKSE